MHNHGTVVHGEKWVFDTYNVFSILKSIISPEADKVITNSQLTQDTTPISSGIIANWGKDRMNKSTKTNYHKKFGSIMFYLKNAFSKCFFFSFFSCKCFHDQSVKRCISCCFKDSIFYDKGSTAVTEMLSSASPSTLLIASKDEQKPKFLLGNTHQSRTIGFVLGRD